MSDHDSAPSGGVPDYPLADTLELDAAQLKVLYDDTRMQIVSLLLERAATTSQLAEVMHRPKGTIGYHCRALEDAGLIRVVRTEQVRAIRAKYYGRTARTFLLGEGSEHFTAPGMLTEAATDIARSRAAGLVGTTETAMTAVRYARIPAERAADWQRRLIALVDEFSDQERGGDTAYLLAVALAPTNRPTFPEDAS